MPLFTFLKNIVLMVIILAIAPILVEGVRTQYARILEPRTPIGVIKIKEKINNSNSLTTQLHSFFKNTAIKGIVLKMNCSQAANGATQNICNEIQHLKKEYPKPIITFVENTCTSGGYLIACASDYIIAPWNSIIGNVAAPYSFITIPDEHIQLLQNDIAEHLTKTIASARKLSPATSSNWGQEKVFTGHQALKIGLIDEIGSLTQVIKILKQKALIDGDIDWIAKPKRYGFTHFLHEWLMLTNNYYYK